MNEPKVTVTVSGIVSAIERAGSITFRLSSPLSESSLPVLRSHVRGVRFTLEASALLKAVHYPFPISQRPRLVDEINAVLSSAAAALPTPESWIAEAYLAKLRQAFGLHEPSPAPAEPPPAAPPEPAPPASPALAGKKPKRKKSPKSAP